MFGKAIVLVLVVAALLAPAGWAAREYGLPRPTPGDYEGVGVDVSAPTDVFGRNDRHHSRQLPASPSPVILLVDGGFDWPAAGIGAGGGIGVALVIVGAAAVFRRRQGLEAT